MEIFRNEEFGEVRTFNLNGEPWFGAADICRVLGIKNSRDAVSKLEDYEKDVVIGDTVRGKQSVSVVNESGVYSLVIRSRKPEARAFKRWLTQEVLPSIRKHGAYMTPEKLSEVRENPAALTALANALASEQNARQLAEERADRIQAELDDLKEKSEIAFSLMDDSGAILVRDLAALLTRRGFKIGQKSLYKYFVENGYLVKCDSGKYAPTLKGGESGFFYTKFQTAYTPYGRPVENRVTMVTSTGVRYFLNTISSPC